MNFGWLAQAPRSALLIGDSLAVGLGPPLASELASRGVALTTRAEVGTSADQWRQRAPAILDSLRPEIVLMSLGSNDAQSSTLTSAFPDNLRAICDSARASGARRCALLRAPNRTTAQVSSGSVESISPPVVQLQSDGIHPSMAGYRAWASAVAPTVAAAPTPSAPRSSLLPWLAAGAAVAAGFWAVLRGRMTEA